MLTTLQQLPHLMRHYGQRTALTLLKESGKEERLSYDELVAESQALACGLIERGLKSGDHVALIGNNSLDWFIAALAVLLAGGVCVPLDSQFSEKQLKYVLNKARPAFAFVTEVVYNRLQDMQLDHVVTYLLLGEPQHSASLSHFKSEKKVKPTAVSENDIAVIFFTSGTTGPPKGVPLTQANLIHQLNALQKMHLVKKSDCMLLPLPLHHVYPFAFGFLLPLCLGVRVILLDSLTGAQIMRALKEKQVTIVLGLPRLYRALLEGIYARIGSLNLFSRTFMKMSMKLSELCRHCLHLRLGRVLLRPLHKQLAPKLTTLVSGGAPIGGEVAKALESLGYKFGTGYGLTETAPLLTMLVPGEGHWESVGKPIPGVSLKIDVKQNKSNEQGETSDPEIGEVLAKGPNVFRQYLDDKEKTQEAFTASGWFRTGDLGKLDKAGYLHLNGRVSTLIVTESGENIQPDQVELAYEEHPAIEEIGVVAEGGSLAAVVVPSKKDTKEKMVKVVAAALTQVAKGLPSYQRLMGFEVSENSLPRTRLGKLERHNLQALYETLKKGKEDKLAVPFSTSRENLPAEDSALLADEAVNAIWEMLASYFPNHPVSFDSSFSLDLGMDSLDWLNLSIEIKECSQVVLTEKQISEVCTVRDLLKLVKAQHSPEVKTDALNQAEAFLTPAQRKWLRPLGGVNKWLSSIGFNLNRWFFKTFFKLTVKGQSNIDVNKPCLILANHTSYLDAPAIAAALDNKKLAKLYWIGQGEIMLGNAFMRFITRAAKVIPINMHDIESNLAFGAAVLKRSHPLVWFPEGRRSATGELQLFQSTVGMLADYFNLPILPVYIEGAYQALPPDKKWPRRHQIKVTFGKLVDCNELKQEGEGSKPYLRINDALYRRMFDYLQSQSARDSEGLSK